MSRSTWGEISKLVISSLLAGPPERFADVDPRDVIGGPQRVLVEELKRRAAAGRPVDERALLAMDDEGLAVLGWSREALLDVMAEPVLVVDLPRHLVEARRLAVLDRLGRLVASGDVTPGELRSLADRLESVPGERVGPDPEPAAFEARFALLEGKVRALSTAHGLLNDWVGDLAAGAGGS